MKGKKVIVAGVVLKIEFIQDFISFISNKILNELKKVDDSTDTIECIFNLKNIFDKK